MDQVSPVPQRQQTKRKKEHVLEDSPLAVGAGAVELAGWEAKRLGIFHGGFEGQAKVIGGWSSVDKVEKYNEKVR